jgi:protein phosphatase 1 regulatory subunit 3A/B/C/D/E
VTTTEVIGEYIVGSCDGFSDKFNFDLDYSAISGIVGRRLQLCIKYECSGNDYWDNNFGKNYIFQCFGPSPRTASPVPIGGIKSSPIETPTSHHAIRSHAFGTFSHSPSALNEDPWLRYL